VAFALETFERQAEAFLRARNWREWQFQSGLRPGRGLVGMYDEDFPDFLSKDLYADLQDAQIEDARRKRRLADLLARANLEGRTRAHAVRATRLEARSRVTFEQEDIAWREAPARWCQLAEVPRRHELQAAWHDVVRGSLTPALERWQAALAEVPSELGGATTDWHGFWTAHLDFDPAQVERLAQALLEASEDVYPHALGVYLAQLELPLDDLWPSDADWAFRAARFDPSFPERTRMPSVVRTFRELGIEIEEQPELRLGPGLDLAVRCLAVDVPAEVHVLVRLIGGHLDYRRTLRGLGTGEAFVQTDRSLPFGERWLGDPTPRLGYGVLFEHLLDERVWLVDRLDLLASDDLRIVQHIDWLRRLRGLAAHVQYERRLWAAEPGSSLAADYEESLTAATRVRHFPDTYLLFLLGAPWAVGCAAVELRAEVFAAQLRAFLRREFDEEWFRSLRAGRFLVQELWRPGQRHTAEELLGFMGYEGFDPAILWGDIAEVLKPV
jgi:hypothetical protein